MLRLSLQFLHHWLTAQTRYGVHSPFVYDFVTQVLPHRLSPVGGKIDALRRRMGTEKEVLEIQDFGAGYGGKHEAVIRKTMREVVKGSARRRRNGEFLRRLFAAYQPAVALELGTNLGFSTAYQLAGHDRCRMISLEGAPTLAEKAREVLGKLGFEADIRVGEFDELLTPLLQSEVFFDAVLLDGNHQYAATVKYFDVLAPRTRPGGFIIVDDIHWSPDMLRAWHEIRSREDVSVSIDLFWMGICFLHRNQQKQDFSFRIRL